MSAAKGQQTLLGIGAPAANKLEYHGTVVRQRFGNDESGFRVVIMQVEPGSKVPTTWVGIMPQVSPGLQLSASGTVVQDPKWGPQLKVDQCLSEVPNTPKGIASYLTTGPFPGIGPKTADAIVAMFGEQTAAVLKEAAYNPELLARVKGITPELAKKIGQVWVEQEAIAPLLVWLGERGVSAYIAGRIVAKFKGNTQQIVENHPYRLTEVNGVGFKTADQIAMAMGIPADSAERAQAGTMHVLGEQTSQGGHCWTSLDMLAEETGKLIQQPTGPSYDAIEALEHAGDVIVFGSQVYAAKTYYAERDVATDLAALLAPVTELPPLPVDDLEPGESVDPVVAPARKLTLLEAMPEALAAFEARTGMVLAPAQRAAVLMLCTNKVMVMTGGPGVGKTATLKAKLAVLKAVGLRVKMVAPTGRAAKRMEELTGLPAATIHRTLGFNQDTFGFDYCRDKKLSCDVLVVDETSMVSVDLAASLLAAVPTAATVLLVGDVDQLPSIGAGAILRNCIDSGVIPTTRLTEIFRQAAGSSIITNAHAINNGAMPVGDDPTDRTSQFVWHKESDPVAAADLILELVTKTLPELYGLDPIRDIAVLPPMKKFECGTIELNQRLQAVLNPHGPEVKRGPTAYRLADKVMQLKNDRERDVYNGDIGFIREVDVERRMLWVDYDGRSVEYTSDQLEHLVHAYAATGHKYQGSSAPCVVIPLIPQHHVMATRAWLYTAVTRAERHCILVADPRTVGFAVRGAKREIRRTGLGDRLRALVKPVHSPGSNALLTKQPAVVASGSAADVLAALDSMGDPPAWL